MGVATKISSDCIVYDDTVDLSPHYQVVVEQKGKQIRYYPPYLCTSIIYQKIGPKLHVKELCDSFVAVWELTSNSSLDDIKEHSAELNAWVTSNTFFRLSKDFAHHYVKQSYLFIPLSTSYYWEY